MESLKVGDKVKRTGNSWNQAGIVHGGIYTVSGVSADGEWLSLYEIPYTTIASPYPFNIESFEVVHQPKFSVGDYVVRTEQEHNGMTAGCIDIVIWVSGDMIDLKDNGNGHWDVFFEKITKEAYIFGQCDLINKVGPTVLDMIATKDTNPKDAVGIKKAPMSTVSSLVLQEVGVAMLEGARKYGRHNYRVAGVRASVYHDAAMRHLNAYWEGQDVDPDSGLSHITKAIAGLIVLRDAQINSKFTDDRPPVNIDLDRFNKELQEKVDQIFDRYPDSKEPYTNV
jgi:hypothetical protein